MNRRIKKKRRCLNGVSYRFSSYHDRKVVRRIQHQLIKECLFHYDTMVIKLQYHWIVVPEVSSNVSTHYKRCLKYNITINEEMEHFHQK